MEELRTGKPINLTPWYEDEVIRETVSHKWYIPLVNPSKNVFIDSTKTKTKTSTSHIGDYKRYAN